MTSISDLTELFRHIFPSPKTHPLIHHSETGLFLLREKLYVEFVQALLAWIDIDDSISTLLTFMNASNTADQPSHPCTFMTASDAADRPSHPRQHRTQPTDTNWFQPEFLLANDTHPRNANPAIPIVGLLLQADHGDPDRDADLIKHFDDLQRQAD